MQEPTQKGPVGVLLAAFVMAAVLTVIAAWAAGTAFWFPAQASTVAAQVDWIFNVITWISIFFFIAIVILMTWFVIKYRRRDHRQRAESQVTHNTPLELTWTIIPLILVIGIFYAGMEGYLNMRRAPVGAYEVQVTAVRWSWNFSHRNGCQEPVLRVPVNRPVRLVMESQDVLHALFIPSFRVKQDIVPGRITDLWFEATIPTPDRRTRVEGPEGRRKWTYDLFCAEYCGKDHSQMHALVIVYEDEEELAADLQECANWAPRTADEDLYIAARTKIYPRCSSCHTLDGRDTTGPTWRDLWKHVQDGEVVFTDGTTLKDLVGPGLTFETPEEYLRDSILNPAHKIVMNFQNAMPSFRGQLRDREVTAIIDFIKRLDEFDDEGNPLPGSQAEQRLRAMEEQAAAQ